MSQQIYEERFIEEEAQAKESVYKVQQIGLIDTEYGQDQYLLVKDNEEGFPDDTSLQICWTYFRNRCYRDTETPGAWYCHRVSVLETHRGDSVIVIIHNERNV